MTATKTTYATLEEVKAAAKSGVTVHWQNSGYTVKQSKFEPEDFNVICSLNGHCAYLSKDYKAEDFYSVEEIQPLATKPTLATPSPKVVAPIFARLLGEYLGGKEKLAEIDRLNAAESNPDICHSHDFCDANVFMLEAVCEALGFGPCDFDCENEEMNEMFNAAWAEARRVGFSNLITA